MIYELKVTLKDVGIPVWRKLQIDGSTTFRDFHRILQAAFNWYDIQLYSFFVNKTDGKNVDGVEISPENNDEPSTLFFWQMSYHDTEEVVADWFKTPKDKVSYVYDFGDDWNHEIVLTKKMKPRKGITYPRCIDARNSAPDEDSRPEVIMGDANLEFAGDHLIAGVNKEMEHQLKGLLTAGNQVSVENDYWPEVLSKAKEFQKLTPWEAMFDEHSFAVVDPVTEERIYCSVLGGGGEVFGLAVYIGDEGYASLMDSLSDKVPDFDFILKQRSLLMSFEDREDLEKADYKLIKSYDIPFRGRKSWPLFRSYKPGYYPWLMDDDEARLMLLGIERSIGVYQEIVKGLEIPDMLLDKAMLVKVPREENGELVFDNQFAGLEEEENEVEESDVPLTVSELELKRIEKFKTMPTAIEFSMDYVDMPVQEHPDERPVFPLLVLAVERTQGLAVYQDLVSSTPGSAVMQEAFLKMIQSMGGVPEKIIINEKTTHFLEPLIDQLKINTEVKSDLPLIRQVMDMLHDDMMPF